MSKYKVILINYVTPNIRIEKEILREISVDLISCPSDDEDTVIRQVSDADVLVTAEIPITEKIIEAAKRCKAIIEAGIGYDNIDVPAASQRGIYVANVPGFCVDEVADHTFGLMLALRRKINILNQRVKKGAWGWDEFKPIFGLKGQTYGVVGFGDIGRAVARRAQAFGFAIIATDPFVFPEEANKYGVELVDFDKLLEISDVVSIHVPLSKSTLHMFNEETFSKMKKTAYLVNTSRGGLVDQKDLYDALASNKFAGAALDVMEEEPPKVSEPLFTLDNVIVTPHIAGYSEDSMLQLRQRISREVARVLKGGQPEGCINCKELSK